MVFVLFDYTGKVGLLEVTIVDTLVVGITAPQSG